MRAMTHNPASRNRDEAVRILEELSTLRPDDLAVPGWSTAATVYALLAIGDQLERIAKQLENPA